MPSRDMSLPIRSFHSRFQLQVESSLEAQGMSPEQVAEFREKNRAYFLRHCRRLVPKRGRLLKCFNSVVDEFWNVIDAKSGEILLRPQAMKAVDLLRKHIEADYPSDPDGVALYYTPGENAAVAAVSEGPTAQRFNFLVFYYHCQVHTGNALTYLVARCSMHAAKYTA